MSPKKRVSVLREILEILRLAWTGRRSPITANISTWAPSRSSQNRLNSLTRPSSAALPRSPAPDVSAVGASAQWIDREIGEAYLDAFRASGQPSERATIDGYLSLFVCDDPANTWDAVRDHYRYQLSRNLLNGLRAVDPAGNVLDRPIPTTDDIERMRTEGSLLFVTPSEAIKEIDKRTTGLPVSGLICHNRICGMPDELSERHVELMATVVKPAIASFGVPT